MYLYRTASCPSFDAEHQKLKMPEACDMTIESVCHTWSVSPQEESVRILGMEGLFLFSSLDSDRDSYLSPEEFKPIVEKLTGTSHNSKFYHSLMTVPPQTVFAFLQGLHPQWMWRRKLFMTPMERLWSWRLKCSLCSSTLWQKARMDFLGYDLF